jgi:hypothetical protein
MIDRKVCTMKIVILVLAPVLVFLGLNYQQLYSAVTIWSETNRLVNLAANTADEFQNPEPVEDNFEGELSTHFWNFTLINGGGKVSNEQDWHSSAMTFDHGLTIQHFHDPDFPGESSAPMQKPAPGQYNNVALIGGGGFRPTPSSDVVLKFSTNVDEGFYGSAGAVFQPAGTLQEDGLFLKPFDMFGFAIVGDESSFQGLNGPLCYLALNWVPVHVDPLSVDVQTLHSYEIRLRWISKTGWLGILKVDDKVMCQMSMPAFGPVEVQVWSDNYLLTHRPRRWWEIAPTMDLKFQDGGYKQFHLEKIQIFEKAR